MLSGQNESCPFSLDFTGNNKDWATKGWQRGLFFFFLLSGETSKEQLRKSDNCIRCSSPVHLPADLVCEIPFKNLASSHLPIANAVLLNVPIHNSTREAAIKQIPSASTEHLDKDGSLGWGEERLQFSKLCDLILERELLENEKWVVNKVIITNSYNLKGTSREDVEGKI